MKTSQESKGTRSKTAAQKEMVSRVWRRQDPKSQGRGDDRDLPPGSQLKDLVTHVVGTKSDLDLTASSSMFRDATVTWPAPADHPQLGTRRPVARKHTEPTEAAAKLRSMLLTRFRKVHKVLLVHRESLASMQGRIMNELDFNQQDRDAHLCLYTSLADLLEANSRDAELVLTLLETFLGILESLRRVTVHPVLRTAFNRLLFSVWNSGILGLISARKHSKLETQFVAVAGQPPIPRRLSTLYSARQNNVSSANSIFQLNMPVCASAELAPLGTGLGSPPPCSPRRPPLSSRNYSMTHAMSATALTHLYQGQGTHSDDLLGGSPPSNSTLLGVDEAVPTAFARMLSEANESRSTRPAAPTSPLYGWLQMPRPRFDEASAEYRPVEQISMISPMRENFVNRWPTLSESGTRCEAGPSGAVRPSLTRSGSTGSHTVASIGDPDRRELHSLLANISVRVSSEYLNDKPASTLPTGAGVNSEHDDSLVTPRGLGGSQCCDPTRQAPFAFSAMPSSALSTPPPSVQVVPKLQLHLGNSAFSPPSKRTSFVLDHNDVFPPASIRRSSPPAYSVSLHSQLNTPIDAVFSLPSHPSGDLSPQGGPNSALRNSPGVSCALTSPPSAVDASYMSDGPGNIVSSKNSSLATSAAPSGSLPKIKSIVRSFIFSKKNWRPKLMAQWYKWMPDSTSRGTKERNSAWTSGTTHSGASTPQLNTSGRASQRLAADESTHSIKQQGPSDHGLTSSQTWPLRFHQGKPAQDQVELSLAHQAQNSQQDASAPLSIDTTPRNYQDFSRSAVDAQSVSDTLRRCYSIDSERRFPDPVSPEDLEGPNPVQTPNPLHSAETAHSHFNSEQDGSNILCSICKQFWPIEVYTDHTDLCVCVLPVMNSTNLALDGKLFVIAQQMEDFTLQLGHSYDLKHMDLLNQTIDIARAVGSIQPQRSREPIKKCEFLIAMYEDIHNLDLSGIGQDDVMLQTFVPHFRDLLTKKLNRLNQMMMTIDSSYENRKNLHNSRLSIRGEADGSNPSSGVSVDDFEVVKPVSRGAYGRLYLARLKASNELFAIKVLRKSDLMKKNAVNTIKNERNILAMARNPFVVRFYYSFDTQTHLFVVMEWCPGGDLYSMVRNLGCLNFDLCRMYIAETVLALEYCHSLNITHRDVKPDNLLIASDGHIKLADFGLSVVGVAMRDNPAIAAPEPYPANAFASGISGMSSASPESPASVPTTPTAPTASALPTSYRDDSNNVLVNNWMDSFPRGSPLSSRSYQEDFSKMRSSSCHSSPTLLSRNMSEAARALPTDKEMDDHERDRGSMSQIPQAIPHISAGLHSPVQSSDMGTARAEDPPTHQAIGTPDYLAPEQLLGQEHTMCVDWWSLGCVLFEFCYGAPPFHADDPEKIFANILDHKIQWPDITPEDEISPDCKDLIKRLLNADQTQRLGHNGATEIKLHPYFKEMDWDNLILQKSCFVPVFENPEDTSYFEPRKPTSPQSMITDFASTKSVDVDNIPVITTQVSLTDKSMTRYTRSRLSKMTMAGQGSGHADVTPGSMSAIQHSTGMRISTSSTLHAQLQRTQSDASMVDKGNESGALSMGKDDPFRDNDISGKDDVDSTGMEDHFSDFAYTNNEALRDLNFKRHAAALLQKSTSITTSDISSNSDNTLTPSGQPRRRFTVRSTEDGKHFPESGDDTAMQNIRSTDSSNDRPFLPMTDLSAISRSSNHSIHRMQPDHHDGQVRRYGTGSAEQYFGVADSGPLAIDQGEQMASRATLITRTAQFAAPQLGNSPVHQHSFDGIETDVHSGNMLRSPRQSMTSSMGTSVKSITPGSTSQAVYEQWQLSEPNSNDGAKRT